MFLIFNTHVRFTFNTGLRQPSPVEEPQNYQIRDILFTRNSTNVRGGCVRELTPRTTSAYTNKKSPIIKLLQLRTKHGDHNPTPSMDINWVRAQYPTQFLETYDRQTPDTHSTSTILSINKFITNKFDPKRPVAVEKTHPACRELFLKQTFAWRKGRLSTHRYKTLVRFGKSLNFAGHGKGLLFKLVKIGTLAREQCNVGAFNLYQPERARKWGHIYSTFRAEFVRAKRRDIRRSLRRKLTQSLLNSRLEKEKRSYGKESPAIDKSSVDFSIQFENFVVVTQPTLAFFPEKKRSFKKKKKIFILKHTLRIAKAKNRLGKLFSIVKHLYFRWKRRHNRTDVSKGVLEFAFKELIYFPRNQIRTSKIQIHEQIGRDAVNDIIFRRRLSSVKIS